MNLGKTRFSFFLLFLYLVKQDSGSQLVYRHPLLCVSPFYFLFTFTYFSVRNLKKKHIYLGKYNTKTFEICKKASHTQWSNGNMFVTTVIVVKVIIITESDCSFLNLGVPSTKKVWEHCYIKLTKTWMVLLTSSRSLNSQNDFSRIFLCCQDHFVTFCDISVKGYKF